MMGESRLDYVLPISELQAEYYAGGRLYVEAGTSYLFYAMLTSFIVRNDNYTFRIIKTK